MLHPLPPPLLLRVLPLVLLLVAPPLAAAFEPLLFAAGEVRKDRRAAPLRFAAPDWRVYHRAPALHRALHTLMRACPTATHLRVHVPPGAPPVHSASNPSALLATDPDPDLDPAAQPLHYISLTSPRRALSRAPHPRPLLFVFGEHGRDLLTPEIALRVAAAWCANDRSDPSALRLPSHPLHLILVPLANPAGRTIAEMGRRCERTNANDVDPDLNWPLDWRHPTQRDPDHDPGTPVSRVAALRDAGRALAHSLHAPHGPAPAPPAPASSAAGTAPFSEPEARALRAIIDKFKPAAYVSVRTGARGITIPWDCRRDPVPEPHRTRLLRISERVAASHCASCRSGSLWNVTAATRCGTAADFVFASATVPFVHTWHVYNVPTAAKGDCFRRHNPTTKDAFDRVVNNWAQAVFNYSTAVNNWMALEQSLGPHSAEQNASLSAAEAVVRRADNLARGMPDPESLEVDLPDHHGAVVPGGVDASAPQNLGVGPRVQGAEIFSWMSGQRGRASLEGGKAHRHPDEQHHGHQAVPSTTEEVKNGLLTGWLGVWAAMFVLGAGLIVVRMYVFKPGPRRSRFLSRAPVKNA